MQWTWELPVQLALPFLVSLGLWVTKLPVWLLSFQLQIDWAFYWTLFSPTVNVMADFIHQSVRVVIDRSSCTCVFVKTVAH